jgi:ABC-2 type transport system permease protein
MQVEEMPPLRELEEREESFTRGRAWGIGFHVVLSAVALLALVIMVNYLAHRHNQRLYISDAAGQKLSATTQRVLAQLTNDVKMIVFFDRTDSLFGPVAGLAKEYSVHSKHINLEFVDARMPGRAEAVRSLYRFKAEGDSGRVIFDSGGQVRTVVSTELSEYGVSEKKEIRRTGFRGEQLFTSAILNVTQTKPVAAYFLQGHGEQSIGSESLGYERFAKLLENNNVTVNTVPALIGTNALPDDCGLLIIAGPTTPIPNEELVKIDQYLGRGGRMLVLMNINERSRSVGIESLLYKWNVQVGFDVVRDPGQAQADDPNVIIASHFGSHPIVRSLLRSSLGLVAPRSVGQSANPQTAPDAPKVTEVLFTSSSGYSAVMQEGNRGVVQRQGPIPLAVAGERGGIQGVKTERGAARFVVVGDAIFLSNTLINYAANADFAALALNWLLNRDSLLSEIQPSPVSEYQIVLTQQQMFQLKWFFLVVAPGIVMILGFFVWLRRRV